MAQKELPEVFDSVIDSGLFHFFSDAARCRYVERLTSVVKPGERPFLLRFSYKKSADQRSRRTILLR